MRLRSFRPSNGRRSSSRTTAVIRSRRSRPAMEVPLGTVKGRVRIALDKLRASLADRLETPWRAAMSCEEATDLLALDAVGALEPSDRDDMERHVATCATCRRAAAEYADLASLLPAALEPVPPPARLRRRLMAQVYAESAASVRLPWWRRLVAAIPASRAFTAVGAVAVVAVIAFGIYADDRPKRLAAISHLHGVRHDRHRDAHRRHHRRPGGADGQGARSSPRCRGLRGLAHTTAGCSRGAAFLSPGLRGGPWTAVIQGSTAGYKSIAATVEPAGGSPAPSNTEVLSGQLAES